MGEIKKQADDNTKDRILASARKQFLMLGFQGASIRRIASEAGVTHGALYGYFGSKEELFYALTDPLTERIMLKLDEIEAEMTAVPAKKRLFRMNDVFYERIPELTELIFEDREIVNLVLRGAKGTKYENFLNELVNRDISAISSAAETSGAKDINMPDQRTLETLMECYMAALFHLIVSGRDEQTVRQSMELFASVFAEGMNKIIKTDKGSGGTKK